MTTLAAPPKPAVAQPDAAALPPVCAGPRRFTREEYYRMAELGFFQDQHVELVDGEILRMSPQSDDHVNAIFAAFLALHRAFGPGYLIRNQANLRLVDSDPEPDLAVVPRSRPLDQLSSDSILLVVEISFSSLAYDRTMKASLYAAAGIRDYWIVNLSDKSLEIRRAPAPDATAKFGHSYSQLVTLVPPALASPLALPDATIPVMDLFN